MAEKSTIKSEVQIYMDWIDFVRPKLSNMVSVLKAQYAEDNAPESWVEWSIGKTNVLVVNDVALVAFVEYFLKKFWHPDPVSQYCNFDQKAFTAARNDSLKEMIAKGEVPDGVDLSYEPSEVAKEKIGLYMAMLCDSHDVMVKNKLEF